MVSQRKKTAFFLGAAVIATVTVVVSCSMSGAGSDAPYSRDPGLTPAYLGLLAIVGWAWLLDRFK